MSLSDIDPHNDPLPVICQDYRLHITKTTLFRHWDFFAAMFILQMDHNQPQTDVSSTPSEGVHG